MHTPDDTGSMPSHIAKMSHLDRLNICVCYVKSVGNERWSVSSEVLPNDTTIIVIVCVLV